LETLEAFYHCTLAELREANNEVRLPAYGSSGDRVDPDPAGVVVVHAPAQRLSVKANLKLARVYLEKQEWTKLKSVSDTYIIYICFGG
jgi:hypothetical protein